MAQQRLTQTRLERLRPKAARYQVPDPECPGLYVRVSPAGGKTFTIVARDPTGKQIWREVKDTLVGDPLDEVRAKAREGLRRLKLGQDPFPPPPAPAESFGAVVERYLKLHVEANRLRSRPEIERVFARYILPHWRDREFEDIRRSDVTRLLDIVVKDHGPRMADLVLAYVGGVMNWQASRLDDYRSPIVRGMARTKPAERRRERILDDDELRTLWPLLDASGSFGAIGKLLLLTGQRREKVAAMRWSDITLDGAWKIATEAREKGNAGELALPKIALDVLLSLPRIGGNDFVFTGRTGGAFISFSKAKAKLDQQAGFAEPWVLHDLRRTARSLMSRAGVRPDIAERVLGHVIGGVEGTYDRHSYFEEKRNALAALAALVERILDPPAENVVPLPARG